MFKIATIVVVIYLAGLSIAQGADESDGPPEQENLYTRLFPACKEFVMAFERKGMELYRNDKIGHRACPDEEYNDGNCLRDDALETRCAVQEIPSEECIAQMTTFMQGETCNLRRK